MSGNRPEREAQFMSWGLGLFIHWSLDSQLGSVISHSLVGASAAYVEKYFSELPKTFNPRRFDPHEWAELARVAGVRYVVMTTKHHSGFCMWDSNVCDFKITNTPYAKDILKEIVDAFRAQEIRIGFYYSPDDFWWLHQNGYRIARNEEYVWDTHNPRAAEYYCAQLDELLGGDYGEIDVLFFDGFCESHLKEGKFRYPVLTAHVHAQHPDVIITRGLMETPEQYTPDQPMPGPWEACYTLGTQWQFKPTNETYKSGGDLIRMLIEMRAKGGNLLLNIGPQPDGQIPFEQDRRVRELALWMFINEEAVRDVRPWHRIREEDIWFTRAAQDPGTLYVHLPNDGEWMRGMRRSFTLASARATEQTTIEVLGQSGEIMEYRRDIEVNPRCAQTNAGLELDIMHYQRIYNMDQPPWPNPIVVKLTHVEPVGEATERSGSENTMQHVPGEEMG
jgi:alpha-L-fucosidase